MSAASLLLACSSDPAGTGGGNAGAPSAGKAGASAAGAGASGLAGGGSSAGGASAAGANSGGSAGAIAGAGGAPSAAGASTGGAAGSGAAGAPAGGASSACPTDATFCSGFEVTTKPDDAVYKANAAPGDWSRDFEVDSTLFHSGKSSLRVKSGSETGVSGAYRMLAVPAPSGAFWVRFYIQQTELDLGGADHNVFASAALSDEPNAASIEFAEDVGIAFNTMDVVRWPTGYGRTMSGGTMPFSLPKGMWHCIEISFDGQGREQQLFINGMQQIDAKDYPASGSLSGTLKNFKFGFNQLHGPARKVWYDDVVVAPSRIQCL
ncbi:MAG: hypothetical protein WDO69_14105 [Pseudomonadota bacterium]